MPETLGWLFDDRHLEMEEVLFTASGQAADTINAFVVPFRTVTVEDAPGVQKQFLETHVAFEKADAAAAPAIDDQVLIRGRLFQVVEVEYDDGSAVSLLCWCKVQERRVPQGHLAGQRLG